MMKRIAKAALGALSIGFMLWGCAFTDGPSLDEASGGAQTAGTGRAVLRVAPPARTLMPTALELGDVTRYEVAFDPQTPDIPGDDTVLGVEGESAAAITGDGVAVPLEAGLWNVTVDAWRQHDGAEYLAARGTAVLTVTATGLTAVTVTLNPIGIAPIEDAGPDDLKGVFAWNLTLPEGVEITEFRLGEPVPHEVVEGVADGSIEKTAGIYAGDYGLRIEAAKVSTGEIAGIFETVHIYPGLVTRAEYDFNDWTFAANVLIAGTLSYDKTGPEEDAVSYMVQAYSDETFAEPIDGASASVGPADASGSGSFMLRVSAAQYAALSPKTVYLRAESLTAGYDTLSQPVTPVEELGVEGRRNVEVSAGVIRVYTIRYHENKPEAASNNVSGVMADSYHTYGETSSLTANAYDLPYWAFAGWAASSNGEAVYGDGDTVAELSCPLGDVINLYALWEASVYTITYNTNLGSLPLEAEETIQLVYDSDYTLPVPTRPGHTFIGWLYYDSVNEEYTLLTNEAGASKAPWKIASNIEIEALWVPEEP